MVTLNKQNIFSKSWLVYYIWINHIPKVKPYVKGVLLDIGCGHKPYYEYFKEGLQNYIGLEHPDTPSESGVVDIYGTGAELPFADESFDTVVSFAVIEHVKEPELMLREAGRVLKKSGFIVMTIPHIWGLHEIPNDFFRYTKYGIEFLLKQGGFTVVEIKALAGFWVTYSLRLCYYLESFRPFIPKSLLAALYFLIQRVGQELDLFHRVESETWAYLAIGQKV